MSKIKILGIAPYEGLRNVMNIIADEREDIELTTYTADLDEGASFVSGMDLENFDAILSRGGTAISIQKITTIPVYDMKTSSYDILNAIKLVDNLPDKVAIVAYPSISTLAMQLCSTLKYDFPVRTTNCWNDTTTFIDELVSDGCTLVLGDMSACRYAKSKGISSMLIASGLETVREAFDQIVNFSKYYKKFQLSNRIMQGELISRKESIFAYSKDKQLAFSSLKEPSNFLLAETSKLNNILQTKDSVRRIKSHKGTLYYINGHRRTFSGNVYYVYYVIMNNSSSKFTQSSITETHIADFNSQLFSTLYASSTFDEIRARVPHLTNTTAPVLIEGEIGTGKDRLAEYIYISGNLKKNPMFTINCNTLTSAELNHLIYDSSSLFNETDFTFYFKNINSLKENLVVQLADYFTSTKMFQRNQIIFSWKTDEDFDRSHSSYQIIRYQLGAISITVPNLNSCIDEIPKLASIYLNMQSSMNSTRLFGVEPEALTLLQGFHWTGNLNQFKKIMNEAIAYTEGSYIDSITIEKLLKDERKQLLMQGEASLPQIKLNQTLKDMTYEIVLRVLHEEDMNQSKTAKRLGISRSTLWRILKNN